MSDAEVTSTADEELIFDWNARGRGSAGERRLEWLDETLRFAPDGARVTELIQLTAALGVDAVHLGAPDRPGATDRARRCREAGLDVACGGTLPAVEHAIDLADRAGMAVEFRLLVGERWTRRETEEAVETAVRGGLSVTLVTPRPLAGPATRVAIESPPEADPTSILAQLQSARAAGAVKVDWAARHDRGLALAHALSAAAHADRICATALGIGRGAPLELVLLNRKLEGSLPDEHDLSHCRAYCHAAAEVVGWKVPCNYPLVGRDAFRTATGVHAAAITKATQRRDPWLADRVYSGVPAGAFGRAQELLIGPLSGASNVRHWLETRRIDAPPALVHAILARAKRQARVLRDDEIFAVVTRHRGER
ncbi:MAG: 2-isopropylmalate synthase [Myxococcota bacterium]